MSKSAKYLARLRPSVLRAGELITIEIDKGKLRPKEAGITVELYEVDNFIAYNKRTEHWQRAHGGMGNKDDLLARWDGTLIFGKKDGEPRWHFRPNGPATLRDKTTRDGKSKNVPIGHVLGASLPIQFEGSNLVFHIPVPFDGTKEEPRSSEGPELELAVVLKRGGELLYSSWDVVSFVRDWRWWASTSFAPPRAGNTVGFFQDGQDYFERVRGVINNAQKRIYITDWKMLPYIGLRRDVPPPEPAYPATLVTSAVPAKPSPLWTWDTVGDALERAAKRGVDVRVLLWKSPGVGQDNLDDMTFAYLMDRGVKCVFHNPFGDKNTLGVYWSHHQKMLLADDAGGADVAFVGGLDLTKSRWDTKNHDPFDDDADPNSGYLSGDKERRERYVNRGYHPEALEQEIKKHYFPPNEHPHSWHANHPDRRDRPALVRDRNPRMGWHDVHSEVSGPAAVDVLRNFVQRWNKSLVYTTVDLRSAGASLDSQFLKSNVDVPGWAGGLLGLIGVVAVNVKKPSAARNRIWRAKADAEACRHFGAAEWWDEFLTGRRSWSQFVHGLKAADLGRLPDEIPSIRPQRGKDIVQVIRSVGDDSVDYGVRRFDKYKEYEDERGGSSEKSIHECYLRAIDCAEHFIYIESQMFISSGFPGAPGKVENRVGGALFRKLKQKIAQKWPFHVYVLLPEIYDGDPFGKPSQEIQKYQWTTITRLIRAVGELARPQGKRAADYISFFALRAAGVTSDGERRVRSNQIYVHSKLMIVDDVFLTMGSANLNDRSLTGYRDTELNVAVLGERDIDVTMGVRRWKANNNIHRFRVSLWREHVGPRASDALLKNPSHRKTIEHLFKLGQRNFNRFDKLYKKEMEFLDLSDEYWPLRHKQKNDVRLGKAPSSRLAKQISDNESRQDELHQEMLALYEQVKDAGHLIIHPYQRRGESKGDMSSTIPGSITR